MQTLILVGFVLLVSLGYGIVVLVALINLGVLPRPEPDQLAACLYWRGRFRASRVERTSFPKIVFPGLPRITTTGSLTVAILIVGATTVVPIDRRLQGPTAASYILVG